MEVHGIAGFGPACRDAIFENHGDARARGNPDFFRRGWPGRCSGRSRSYGWRRGGLGPIRLLREATARKRKQARGKEKIQRFRAPGKLSHDIPPCAWCDAPKLTLDV